METLDLDRPSSTARFESEPTDVTTDASSISVGPITSAFSHLCLLVIGAGKTAEAMAAYFQSARPRRLIIANRTLSNGRSLADRFGGEAVSLDYLPEHLTEADVVISCTASERPIVTKSAVQEAVSGRRHQPLFVADIALRGDVDADVRSVDDVFVTSVSEVCADEAVDQQARAVLSWHLRCLRKWQEKFRSQDERANLLRRSAEDVRDAALQKAGKMLQSGKRADDVLAFLANAITNKFLHSPSAQLRDAALRGDRELLRAGARLFDVAVREN